MRTSAPRDQQGTVVHYPVNTDKRVCIVDGVDESQRSFPIPFVQRTHHQIRIDENA